MRVRSWLFLQLCAAAAMATDCSLIEGNLVPSCGFESTVEVADWTALVGSVAFDNGQGETGSAALVTSVGGSFPFAVLRSPCIDVNPGRGLAAGYVVRRVGQETASCSWTIVQYSDDSCATPLPDELHGPTGGGSASAYVAIDGSVSASTETSSVQLSLSCAGLFGVFQFDFDNAYLVEGDPSIVEVPTMGFAGIMALALALLGAGLISLRSRPSQP
jgi:hypothetical protein